MGKHYKILCVNSGEVYDNAASAARALNVSESTISYHLKGRTKFVSGTLFLVQLSGYETAEDIERIRRVHLKRIFKIDLGV